MSPFDFVCAFYSVVLGVAVAQLMTSVGRLLEVRDQVRTYWVQSLWVEIVLLYDVNNWLAMWSYRSAKSWRVVSFLLLVGLIASIYLVTVLLFPRVPESRGQIDLDAHYYKNRRVFLDFDGHAQQTIGHRNFRPDGHRDPIVTGPGS